MVPFMARARVDIAIEPSDVLDFVRLYFNDKAVGDKLQGMLQVNTIIPWHPRTQSPFMPKRLQLWREARAKYNSEGLAKDPVGLVKFIGCSCAEDSKNSLTAELHIPAVVLDMARQREPFTFVSAVTGMQFNKPMSTVTCLEYVLRSHPWILASGASYIYIAQVYQCAYSSGQAESATFAG
ncbi:uncharacterized protein F5891DRAFT_963508 [Suillus fuscotomentosus]|uniref:DUF8205 domain-containing protein n=1 Tax=Suillus fuscotomentosus TaxID=1912939 RepID=A0AAD4DSG6_9AGAM|nr:uncharacterized protein F5891DRAFT_963508 [Suillus fuscotomentosus]KAG1893090.1 hypothetical protein F5891DRAFT_963508 [Suillus fuscotomentosus]